MTDQRRTEIRDRIAAAAFERPLLMGILNATPDSFSDGGAHNALPDALRRSEEMIHEGADILDIGGESTRPGATPVPEAEELSRTIGLIGDLYNQTAIPLSIDTYKAQVALAAARAGAVIINDVWGMTKDAGMASAVAETGSIIIVTYNRGKIVEDGSVVDDMRDFFDDALALAQSHAIADTHIWLDPGIGFHKTLEQNFTLLQRLDALLDYDLPVLAGLSRKSFIGKTLGNEVGERLYGTIGADLAALAKGASILRVHDVAPHAEAMRLFLKVIDPEYGDPYEDTPE